MGEAPLAVVIPVYNDRESARRLLVELDRSLASAGIAGPIHILLVNDDSSEPLDGLTEDFQPTAVTRVERVDLTRNLGHQRAICVGLVKAGELDAVRAVVVMDGDGEDRPEDVPTLLEECARHEPTRIVFAERTRRSEGGVFRVFYRLYCFLHVVLTGIPVRVGNFSVVPGVRLPGLLTVSEIWNHYAAGVFVAQIPRVQIPTVRGERYAGQSRMNFAGLVMHGLSALSVHAPRTSVRMLVGAVLLTLLSGLATPALSLAGLPAAADLAAVATAFLLLVSIQSFFLTLLVLGARSTTGFLPARDGPRFVRETVVLLDRTEES